MLRSMTGFGEAHCQQDGSAVAVEVRTINSRYFKLSVRSAEGCAALEPKIEVLVRKQVRRGTIQVMLRMDRARSPDDYKINVEVLEGYRRQLEAMHGRWNLPEPVPLESLLLLPGVADENSAVPIDAGAHWPLISVNGTATIKLQTDAPSRTCTGSNPLRPIFATPLPSIP